MPKPRTRKPKFTATATIQTVGQDSPGWVESMQAHFQQTGYYRANDLNRLLGDPRDAVVITIDDGVKVQSLAAK